MKEKTALKIMKALSERTSFYSHKKFPRKDGVRFVKCAGELRLDPLKTLPGRGAYLRYEEVPLVLKAHLLSRAFHQSVSPLEEENIKKAYESLTK